MTHIKNKKHIQSFINAASKAGRTLLFDLRSSQSGASLIAVAILVTVLGVMAAPAFKLYMHRDMLQRVDKTENTVVSVQEALDRFVVENGRLPCPAGFTTRPDNNNFGTEIGLDTGDDCSAVGEIEGTTRPGGNVRIGAVPVRSLNLPDDAMLDAWGHRLTYAVTEEFAVAGADMTNGVGRIGLVGDGGAPSTSSPNNIFYLVVSQGPDTRGAYTLDGAEIEPCAANGIASENCDRDDAIFRQSVQERSMTGGDNPGGDNRANMFTNNIAFKASSQQFVWWATNWDFANCSAAGSNTCDANSTKTRQVFCLRSENSPPVDVADAAANNEPGRCSGPGPSPEEPCDGCWNLGDYGACDVPCGGGTQTRLVTCVGDCSRAGSAPLISQPCNGPNCNFVTTGFTSCTASCGGGTTTEIGTCQNPNDSNAVVNNRWCPGHPASSVCNTVACFSGVCGSADGDHVSSAPTSNLCSLGTPTSVSGSGPWSWTCEGNNTFSSADDTACSADILETGSCGTASTTPTSTAPNSGLCSSGTPSAVTGTGPWNWTCEGNDSSITSDDTSCSASVSSCPAGPISWTIGGNTCDGTINTTTSGSSETATDSSAPTTGSANFTCSGTAWNATPDPGATCNGIPVNANDDTFTTPAGSSDLLDVLANDTGTGISIDSVTTGSGGCSVSVSGGQVSITTPAAANYECNFSYTAIDSGGNTDNASVCVSATGCTGGPSYVWGPEGCHTAETIRVDCTMAASTMPTCGAQGDSCSVPGQECVIRIDGNSPCSVIGRTCNPSTNPNLTPSCVIGPPPGCSATTHTWTVGSNTCSGNVTAASHSQTRPANDTTAPETGTASFLCNAGTWVEQPGATCNGIPVNANDDTFTTPAGSSDTLDVLSNDTGTGLSVDSVTTGSGGCSVSLSGGQVRVTTPAAANYECNFAYTAIDSSGNTDSANVCVSATGCAGIVQCPAGPVSWTVGGNTCNGSLSITTSGSADTANDMTAPTTGTATFQCTGTTFNALPNPGATCNVPTPTVNGVCRAYSGTHASQPANNTSSGCLSGNYVNRPDDASNWRWRCTGSGPGPYTNMDCSAARPAPTVNGVCRAHPGTHASQPANNTFTGCTSGTFVNLGNTAANWQWRCDGSGPSHTNQTCSAARPTPVVNGSCGSAHNNNFSSQPPNNPGVYCSTGTRTGLSWDRGGRWVWTCAGNNAASSADDRSCVAYARGQCGPDDGVAVSTRPTAPGLCTRNYGSVPSVSGSGPWSWTCGGGRGSANASCGAPRLALPAGRCGSAGAPGAWSITRPTSNLCAVGTPSAVSGSGPWSWTCSGSPAASCSSLRGCRVGSPTVWGSSPRCAEYFLPSGSPFSYRNYAPGTSFTQTSGYCSSGGGVRGCHGRQYARCNAAGDGSVSWNLPGTFCRSGPWP